MSTVKRAEAERTALVHRISYVVGFESEEPEAIRRVDAVGVRATGT